MNSMTTSRLRSLVAILIVWSVVGTHQTRADDDVKLLATFKPGKHTDGLAFDHYGKVLASLSRQDETIRVWDLATGKERHCFKETGLWLLAFSSDDKTLIASGDFKERERRRDGGYEPRATLQMWDVESGKSLPTLSKVRGGTYPALSLDGKTLVAFDWYSKPHSMKVYDVATAKVLATFVQEPLPSHHSLFISPNGKAVARVDGNGPIVLYDVPSGKRKATLKGRPQDVAQSPGLAAFSPDGKLLATGGKGNGVILWDVATGKEKSTLTPNSAPASDSSVRAVAFSPDGKFVVSGGEAGTVRMFDTTNGKLLLTLQLESKEWVTALAFTTDGRRLATGGYRGTITMWDVTGVKTAE